MSLRVVSPGYLYILSNDFPTNEMITITKSQMPPEAFIEKVHQDQQTQWVLARPTEILYECYLDQCSLVESRIHEFLISHGFSGGAPKDYQISFEDALFLIKSAIYDKVLNSKKIFPSLHHTEILPEEGCNYHVLGHLFNGTYGKQNETDPFHKDEKSGFACFKRGAELGDEKCFYQLGLCYEHGIGTEVEFDKSLEFYRNVFAFDPCQGVNELFRIYLKKDELLRATGIVENFLKYCDQSSDSQLPRLGLKGAKGFEQNENLVVQKVLDGHRDFVKVLSKLLIDCHRIVGDWDILSGYKDIFQEFSYSIQSYFDNEYNFLTENKFNEMAENIQSCKSKFISFVAEKSEQTG